jgi:hypothetical protein
LDTAALNRCVLLCIEAGVWASRTRVVPGSMLVAFASEACNASTGISRPGSPARAQQADAALRH